MWLLVFFTVTSAEFNAPPVCLFIDMHTYSTTSPLALAATLNSRHAGLLGHRYSGTGLESRVFVSTTIGLFGEPNFRSPLVYVCSKPGVSFNTSMRMDHTNKP